MRRRRGTTPFAFLVVAAILTPPAFATGTGSAGGPPIAAASDLKFAMDELTAAFRRASGRELMVTFGSSGNFARQIEQGAPFELFFSADEQLVLRLAERGLTRDQGVLYAVGRIAIFAPAGSALRPDPQLQGLKALLATGDVKRFAIANPEHAPYGRAAEQALRTLGLWGALAPKLVLGENVAQAAQFAMTGDASGGIIAYSLALAPEIRSRGNFALIPAELHQPLRQRMVLMNTATPVAARFYEFVQQPAAREILRRFGFALPGE